MYNFYEDVLDRNVSLSMTAEQIHYSQRLFRWGSKWRKRRFSTFHKKYFLQYHVSLSVLHEVKTSVFVEMMKAFCTEIKAFIFTIKMVSYDQDKT